MARDYPSWILGCGRIARTIAHRMLGVVRGRRRVHPGAVGTNSDNRGSASIENLQRLSGAIGDQHLWGERVDDSHLEARRLRGDAIEHHVEVRAMLLMRMQWRCD